MDSHRAHLFIDKHKSPVCKRKVASRRDLGSNEPARRQLPSLFLFLTVIILVNLCPFKSDFEHHQQEQQQHHDTRPNQLDSSQKQLSTRGAQIGANFLLGLRNSFSFMALMFTNPIKLGTRSVRFSLAESKVIGKMAKVWYIKKKIKKLSKKLKKHTIAVPVFTAIPIYEHSYYPQPHVTHVTHAGMHHAASSYSPSLAQTAAASTTAAQTQQLATSASNQHHQLAAYRLAPHHPHHHHQAQSAAAFYHPYPQVAASHQIINAYAPAPPTYVDESAGLYGHYGNAYGRYDGGFHLW